MNIPKVPQPTPYEPRLTPQKVESFLVFGGHPCPICHRALQVGEWIVETDNGKAHGFCAEQVNDL